MSNKESRFWKTRDPPDNAVDAAFEGSMKS
jgi:hypothetical protein